MFATDTALEFRTYGTTLLNCHLNKLAYTVLVEYLEGVNLQDLLLEIYGQEAGDIVAAVAEGHLCEVVCAE